MNPDGQYPSMQVAPPVYSAVSPDVNYPRPTPAPGMQPAPGMPAPGMLPAPGMQPADMNASKEKGAMGHDIPMMYSQQANVPFMPYNVIIGNWV